MLPNGPAAAAMLAAGVGCVALGLLVTLTAASVFVEEAMVFYEPVGSLSGKTTLAVVIWLVVWVVLNSRLKDKQVNFAKTLDRKSTRLNSSHANISYAVFCLKK